MIEQIKEDEFTSGGIELFDAIITAFETKREDNNSAGSALCVASK